MPALTTRRPGSHGAYPLSPATRKRMLTALLDRAEGGDAIAMAELVRLSWEAERQVKAPAHTA